MQITSQTLAAIAGKPVNSNMASTVAGLSRAGVGAGLNRPHRLAMYLGQLAHESMGWHYDREVWGPTKAQKGYEGRKDLGNTQPGDGSKFRGFTPMQITGRANTTDFRDWARKIDSRAPDFVATPELMNTDPWEGLGPIWYWETRGLNRYADQGDFLTVTRRINGGTNGLADRERRYVQAGLVLLGYGPGDVRRFQTDAGLKSDGVAGPQTRAALHRALSRAMPATFAGQADSAPAPKPDTPTARPSPNQPPALPSWLSWLVNMFKGRK